MSSVERIFLVGMPGTGKSYFGKTLAAELKLPFVDLDAEIEAKTGLTISEIFESLGEQRFRAIESECLNSCIGKLSTFVMATGGGSPCFHEGIKVMKDAGITVYLKTDLNTLIDRLKQDEHRPLIDQENIEKKTKALFDERKEIYEQAHLTVNHRSVPKLLTSIRQLKS